MCIRDSYHYPSPPSLLVITSSTILWGTKMRNQWTDGVDTQPYLPVVWLNTETLSRETCDKERDGEILTFEREKEKNERDKER